MKKLLSIIMLAVGFQLSAFGQITIQLPKNLVTESRLKSYVDSVISANKSDIAIPVDPVPPVVALKPCDRGPEIKNIYDITSTAAKVLFDGQNVFGIDFKVYNSGGQLISSGAIKPSSSTINIPYTSQTSGTYKLVIAGNTCSGHSEKTFEIKKSESVAPIVPSGGDGYELILNTTGRGFSNSTSNGLEADMAEYVDKFKFSWGYGVSGIRVLVRWYDFEPKEGEYKTEAVKRLIDFCKQRDLSLSICFWPLLKGDDPRLTSLFVLSNKKPYYAVSIADLPQYSEACNNYVDASSNLKIAKAVTELSRVLYSYEKAGYISLGGGSAEEMVYPYRDNFISDFSESNIQGFYSWLKNRGIAAAYPPLYTSLMDFVPHNGEIGKEWLRYNTYTLKAYFDNFVAAVKAGNEKGKACYFIGAMGTPATQWTQDGLISYTAANADEFYHTDGTRLDNVYRKTLGVNVGIGTLDIPTDCEFDQEDLGDDTGGGFDGNRLEHLATEAFRRGAKKVHLAMQFKDDQIAGTERSLKNLMTNIVGKPWTKPVLTDQNTKVVDITEFLWNGGWVFGDDTNVYIKAVAPNFWGEIQP